VAADARRQRGRQGTYLLDWLIRLRHPRPPKTWVVARARQRGRDDWDENDAGSPKHDFHGARADRSRRSAGQISGLVDHYPNRSLRVACGPGIAMQAVQARWRAVPLWPAVAQVFAPPQRGRRYPLFQSVGTIGRLWLTRLASSIRSAAKSAPRPGPLGIGSRRPDRQPRPASRRWCQWPPRSMDMILTTPCGSPRASSVAEALC
jgi:hypothetical protein